VFGHLLAIAGSYGEGRRGKEDSPKGALP